MEISVHDLWFRAKTGVISQYNMLYTNNFAFEANDHVPNSHNPFSPI
jgi:hypothetical protein